MTNGARANLPNNRNVFRLGGRRKSQERFLDVHEASEEHDAFPLCSHLQSQKTGVFSFLVSEVLE